MNSLNNSAGLHQDKSDPKSPPHQPKEDNCHLDQSEGPSQIDLRRAMATGNFTTAEAAHFLGVSRKTLWNWKCAGKIKAFTLNRGRSLRFDLSELRKQLRG